MSTPSSDTSVRDRLDAAVVQALRENNQAAAEAGQETIGALETAADNAPRDLTEAEMLAIVLAEAVAREGQAAEKRSAGDDAQADRLVSQASFLREFTA